MRFGNFGVTEAELSLMGVFVATGWFGTGSAAAPPDVRLGQDVWKTSIPTINVEIKTAVTVVIVFGMVLSLYES
jgi:hypothetical protein